MKNKFFVRQMMVFTICFYGGVILIVYPLIAYHSFIGIEIMSPLGIVLLIVGFLFLFYAKLYRKIEDVSKGNSNSYGIRDVVVTENNSLKDIIKDVENKKFIYKLSVFLSDPTRDDIFYLKDLLHNNNIDSKIRILISISKEIKDSLEKTELIKELEYSNKNQPQIRIIKQGTTFSYLIFDTNIWLINPSTTKEIKTNIHFKIDTNSKLGEEYIWFFNNNWDLSESINN